MSMYVKQSNKATPISMNQSNLRTYLKHYISDTLPGLTESSSLSDICEGGLLPSNSEVVLWINDSTRYGQEFRLNAGKYIGWLLIQRFGETRYLTFRAFNQPIILINTQSDVNSVGWLDYWYKVNVSEQHVNN